MTFHFEERKKLTCYICKGEIKKDQFFYKLELKKMGPAGIVFTPNKETVHGHTGCILMDKGHLGCTLMDEIHRCKIDVV